MPNTLNWPARPTYPDAPPAGATTDEITAWYHKVLALSDQYSADIGAFQAAILDADFVNSTRHQNTFLMHAILEQLGAGKTGPGVLTEANAQLAALVAQLSNPTPIPAPV